MKRRAPTGPEKVIRDRQLRGWKSRAEERLEAEERATIEVARREERELALTPAELDFRDLQRNPKRRAEWLEHVRSVNAKWFSDRGLPYPVASVD